MQTEFEIGQAWQLEVVRLNEDRGLEISCKLTSGGSTSIISQLNPLSVLCYNILLIGGYCVKAQHPNKF